MEKQKPMAENTIQARRTFTSDTVLQTFDHGLCVAFPLVPHVRFQSAGLGMGRPFQNTMQAVPITPSTSASVKAIRLILLSFHPAGRPIQCSCLSHLTRAVYKLTKIVFSTMGHAFASFFDSLCCQIAFGLSTCRLTPPKTRYIIKQI